MDYVSLGLACEELEYVDTHLRVIMSVHVGLNSMTLWCWGTDGAEEEVPRAPGEGREDRDLRPHRAERRLRRGRHPDDRRAQGRPLRAERREDVDQPRRRGRPLPRHRLDGPGEEEEARPLGHVGLHRRARLQGLLARSRSRRSGGSSPATPAASRCRTSRCRSRTAWARRARASRSRCSPSRTGATPWPPARPASSAPAATPRSPTRRPARPSACRSASTSSSRR